MKDLRTYVLETKKISSVDDYINEGFKLGKNKVKKRKTTEHKYFPKNKRELNEIIKKKLKKDKNANLNDIDVSNIVDMSFLFIDLDPHNIDISEWDVSNVEDMSCMFTKCTNFNSDLSEWDVSIVEDMNNMFYKCTNFNSDLSEWNVSKVEYMYSMFYGCKSFEGKGLENWNVSNGVDIDFMFGDCDSLKKIPSWYKEK